MATAPSSSSPSSPATAPSSPATAPSSPATATSLPFIAPASPSSPSPISNVIAFHHHRLSSPSLPSTAPSSSSPSFPVFTSSSTPPSSPSLPVFTSSSTPPSSPVTAGTNTTPPPSSSVVPDAVSAVQFLSSCHSHKKRKGTTRWLRSDVKNPESIADHTYGKSMMALIAPDVPGLDRNKCIKMAIIHDTAEGMLFYSANNVSLDEVSRGSNNLVDCKSMKSGRNRLNTRASLKLI
ncbi:uncharacterized protein LOC131643587 [Vicia villosa]|uniref:uncharacterized protein LOC131643587 n=1 Tax=Vicia villosa TaxID=3911 RepID=UPI00273AD848|nr:uncharacterized protein LOC131643587 [Vicia villosa]